MTTTLRVPRSRGALSGLLLVLLGLWGALMPLIGPYFHFGFTPDKAWHCTSGRVWLQIVPGLAVFLGGLIALGSANRAFAAFGAWLEEAGAASGKLVYTEKAGVNSIVVDSTDNLRGVLGNLAFSLTLYSGQMCTTPQNIYVPREGISTDEGPVSFEEFGEKLAAAVGRLTGDDAKAVELLGATVNDGVRANAGGLADLAEEAGGTVVLPEGGDDPEQED